MTLCPQSGLHLLSQGWSHLQLEQMTLIGFDMPAVVCFISRVAVKQAVTSFICLRGWFYFQICGSVSVQLSLWTHQYVFTVYRHVCSNANTVSECVRGMLMCRVSFAGTQRWPCRCSTTPDTAPGGGWQWWLLWCGSFLLPSPALYCLDWTILVTAPSDTSSQVTPHSLG